MFSERPVGAWISICAFVHTTTGAWSLGILWQWRQESEMWLSDVFGINLILPVRMFARGVERVVGWMYSQPFVDGHEFWANFPRRCDKWTVVFASSVCRHCQGFSPRLCKAPLSGKWILARASLFLLRVAQITSFPLSPPLPPLMLLPLAQCVSVC